MKKRNKKKTISCHVQKMVEEPILLASREELAAAIKMTRRLMCNSRLAVEQTKELTEQEAILNRLKDTIVRALHQQLESDLAISAANIGGDFLRHTLKCNLRISASLILADLIGDLSKIFYDDSVLLP